MCTSARTPATSNRRRSRCAGGRASRYHCTVPECFLHRKALALTDTDERQRLALTIDRFLVRDLSVGVRVCLRQRRRPNYLARAFARVAGLFCRSHFSAARSAEPLPPWLASPKKAL